MAIFWLSWPFHMGLFDSICYTQTANQNEVEILTSDVWHLYLAFIPTFGWIFGQCQNFHMGFSVWRWPPVCKLQCKTKKTMWKFCQQSIIDLQIPKNQLHWKWPKLSFSILTKIIEILQKKILGVILVLFHLTYHIKSKFHDLYYHSLPDS